MTQKDAELLEQFNVHDSVKYRDSSFEELCAIAVNDPKAWKPMVISSILDTCNVEHIVAEHISSYRIAWKTSSAPPPYSALITLSAFLMQIRGDVGGGRAPIYVCIYLYIC